MRSRPFSLTLLAWIVLLFTAVNLARLVLSISKWNLWAELLPIWPGYLVLTGLIWTVVGAVIAWGLFRARPWARWLTPAVYLLYSAYLWIERLFLTGNPERNENWLFALGLNIIVVLFCLWVMSWQRVKAYFGQQDDKKVDDQPIG